MATIINEASCNYDLISGQQIMTTQVVDTVSQNNGKLIVDTDTKWNAGHTTSAGASNGSLDSITVSATSINGGITIDGTNVSVIPYTSGSGTAPTPTLISGGATTLTVAAAATTGTFSVAVTLDAGVKLYTSTGTYIGTIKNAVVAATTCNLAAAAQASQAAAAVYFYQPWAQPIIDATWSANVATLTFSYNHGYSVGDWIGVGGLRGTDVLDGYNGTFEITAVPTSTTLSYALTTNPGAYFKTLGSGNLTAATGVATLTFSTSQNLPEGWVLYNSSLAYCNIVSNWVNGTAGVGITNNVGLNASALAFYYGTGKCIRYPRCDQTQTSTITNISSASNIATVVTSANHTVAVGNSVVITGTTNYNGTFTVATVISATSFTFSMGSSPATETTGTITKTVKSVFLGAWANYTTPPATNGAIPALGFMKVKAVSNSPYRTGTALTIAGLGAATPVATCAGDITRGWIEVVGTESGSFTVPRVASFNMNGDWFSPKVVPFTITSSTAAVVNAVTITTSTHNLGVGSIVTLSGQSITGLNGTWVVTTVPSTTTFTITDNSFVGLGASTGGVGYGRLTVNNTAQQIVQLPAGGGSAVSLTNYAGVWVEKASTFGVISTASWAANVVTFTTTTLGPFIDGLSVGDQFQVLNVTPAAYNGIFTVTGKSYASTTTVTITAAMTNNPGTYTSGGSLMADLTVSSASYASGYVTITTNKAHGLYAGQTVEMDLSVPSTYNGIYEIFDAPSTTTFRIPVTANPGTLTSTRLVQYEFYPSVGNMVATASCFPTNSEQGKFVSFLSASGACRFGGDGTNAWGFLPHPGARVIVPNIVGVNTTKAATTGVLTQVIPNATLTTRPKIATGGVIGTVSVTRANLGWYLQAPQAYSFTFNHVGQCESINFSEIATSFRLNDVGTGISGVASSAQTSALNVSLIYGGGTITNCVWGKFHNGTSGNYAQIWADMANTTVINDSCLIMRTTATAGGTARNATSGSRSLTRVANCTFSKTRTTGGTNLLTTCTNLTWTNNDYMDTLEGASTATTTQVMFGITTLSSNIKVDGVTFGRGIVANTQPVAGIFSALVGSNNVKIRNVGTVTAPLSAGSTNPLTYIMVGAAGAAAYNISVQRVYTTLTSTGLMNAVDNSYSGLTFEDVWVGGVIAYTNTPLNTVLKKHGGTNVVAGQTAVYGHHWEDFYTPYVTTVATGTAWNTTAGGNISFTTAAAHNLVAGDIVTVSGVVNSAYSMVNGYNGTFTVLASPAPTSTTFSVAQPNNPGTWTSGGSLNPQLGKIVLQMNEKTSIEPSASSYVIDSAGPGSSFTSVGTLALLNVGDGITWTTPYWLYGHRRFTYGSAAPWTTAAPTFTATNPNNHDWYYDLDKGTGMSGTFKPLHLKLARGAAKWAITSTTTCTLTQDSTSFTGSISNSTLTVTAVSSGSLAVGSIISGAGVTTNTIITSIISAPLGTTGTYGVQIITFPGAATPTLAASVQTVGSVAMTGVTSLYGMSVGDTVFDITTPANVATGATVASITNATVFTLSTASTNSTLQTLAVSSIHSETGIVAATGFKMKVRVRINTYAATNLLTTVAIPTSVSAQYQATQYPLDTLTLSFTGLSTGSDVVILAAGTNTERASVDANATSTWSYVYSVQESVDIGVFKAGYVPFYIRNYSLGSTNASLPVAQVPDRNYA